MNRITPGLFGALCALILCAVTVPALLADPPDAASPDLGAKPRRAILFVGPINDDCLPDTLIGVEDKSFRFRPDRILWGRSAEAERCPGQTGSKARTHTAFQFPNSGHLAVDVATRRLDPDTLTDLIFFLRWRTESQGMMVDTSRILVLFGQQGLDTLAGINLATTARFHSEGYVALELEIGRHLTDPKSRDFSGRQSYVLLPVSVAEKEGGDEPPPIVPAAVSGAGTSGVDASEGVSLSGNVRLSPNPAGYSVRLESRSIPSGSYEVEIATVGGSVVDTRRVTVRDSGQLQEVLDLESLSSGYYVVRLRSAAGWVGAVPLIIVR